MENKNIIPVLIGADMNCYNVARAFHEQYGVKSYAFGRYAIGASNYTRIIKFTVVEKLDDPEVMVKTLTDFAEKHEGATLIAFGCTDDYASMLIHYGDRLRPRYIVPYIGPELFERLAYKASFYEDCDRHGILYPKTKIVTPESDLETILDEDSLGFEYPIIIKPSASAVYWHYPFDGMKKVYTADSPERAAEIVNEIYSSGYPEKIILQEFIAGGDSQMRVFTCFSDEHGKVRAMCLGHTMLEEHTPKGLGNHAAIVTEPVSSLPIADKIKDMLEALGYTGFSNFDIKLREGTKDDFRVFEINLRQGRSNFYLTSAGLNVAYLANEVYESDGNDCNKVENVVFWHHIPKSTAYKYTEDKALVEKAKKLAREGREYSSVWYTPDMRFNPLRIVCVLEQLRRQKGKFKKYYPVKK